MQEFLSLAEFMADEAGKIIRTYFRQPFDVECKSDDSPVTRADREVEHRLCGIIARQRPEDGIHGEETGVKDSRSGYTWIFDPIDGTKQFAGGRPTFCILIALCYEGRPLMSIMDQPILGERWVGVKDRPTTFNGKIVRTRACKDLKTARLGMTSPRNLAFTETLAPLHEATQFIAWGGHAYGFAQLASGWLDVVMEKHFGPFDTVPVVPIVEGAGGIITDWSGNPPNLTGKGKVLAAGDPATHEQMLDFLRAHGEAQAAARAAGSSHRKAA